MTTRTHPWSMAIAAMLAVQVSNALSVGLIDHAGAAGAAWLRMCFGALLLWMFTRPDVRSLKGRDVPALVALGVVTGFMTTLFLAAIARIPLGTSVAIEFLGPLSVASFMSKHRRALVRPVFALIGVVLLSQPWHGGINGAGVGFALASGACWGTYNLLTQHVGDRFAGISGLALTIPAAAIATTPLGLTQTLDGRFAWWLLPVAAGVALITPVIAFGLEMLALRRMNHAAFGTLLAIEPAFGVLIGLMVLGQTPQVLQLAGIGLVVLSGAAAQHGGTREPHPSEELMPTNDAQIQLGA